MTGSLYLYLLLSLHQIIYECICWFLFDITRKDLEESGLSLIKVMDVSGDSEEDHTNLSKDMRYLSGTQTGHQPDPGVDGHHENTWKCGRVA